MRKRIAVTIPLPGPEDWVRDKKVARPDKFEAVAKHQTRMLNPGTS